VSPNNPTGSIATTGELESLVAFCESRSLTIIADEVFRDYVHTSSACGSVADQDRVLAFSLGGLSKSAGLPQLKLSWLVVSGPAARVEDALPRLELIADSYLSVSTPVQEAAATLLDRARVVRAQIKDRLAANLECLRKVVRSDRSCELLEPEGGWSAVIRVPAIRTEEDLVVGLLNERRVLVHPGFFFDFPDEAFVVVSLLPPCEVFARGISHLVEYAGT
jgi:aspartate/methionine/tyrosine aminotransferase